MACLEFEYKNQPIKITNGIGSSAVSAEGQTILLNFVQFGILPSGYSIFWSKTGEEIKTDDAKKIFNEIIEDYLKTKDSTLIKRYINMDPETIDSYYANQDWSDSLYDKYLYQNTIGLKHNYWYMKGLGGKSLYGFTKNRPLKISGWKEQRANFVDDTLLNAYCELRNNTDIGSNFIHNTITKLYNKYYAQDDSIDVYAKMTKLANNQLQDLVMALYIPRSVKQSGNKEELSKLLESPKNLKGLSTKYKGEFYLFTGKGDNDTLEVLKLTETGTETVKVPIKDIKDVYQTFTINDKTGTYIIINKTWYKVSKNKYLPVDVNISNQLFETWFGVPNDQNFKVINVYSKDNPVHLDTKINDRLLGEGLPVGSYIRSAKGYYTKMSSGEFKNGDEVLSNTDTIYQIFYNNIDAEGMIDPNSIATNNVEEDTEVILSEQEMKIVMYDLGMTNLSEVWFDYQSENVSEFFKSSDGRYFYKVGIKNAVQSIENIRRVKLGIKYYQAFKNESMPKSVLDNIQEVFEYIITRDQSLIKDLNLSEEALNFISSFWILDETGLEQEYNPNEWQEILDSNKQELAKEYYQLTDDSVSVQILKDDSKIVCSLI